MGIAISPNILANLAEALRAGNAAVGFLGKRCDLTRSGHRA
jgi:hypothetical protein